MIGRRTFLLGTMALAATGCTGPRSRPTATRSGADFGAGSRVCFLDVDDSGWLAAGSAPLAGAAAPAVWRRPSGERQWHRFGFESITYYGERSELYSVSRGSGTRVAIGGEVGGVHGNPRRAFWRVDEQAGTFTELSSLFEALGGPSMISIGTGVTRGEDSWYVGTRSSLRTRRVGGGLWRYAGGDEVLLDDDVPSLRADEDEYVMLRRVTLGGGVMIAVGDRFGTKGDATTHPLLWRSDDGERWERIDPTTFAGNSARAAYLYEVAVDAGGTVHAAGVRLREDGASEVYTVTTTLSGEEGEIAPIPSLAPDSSRTVSTVTSVAADGNDLYIAGRLGTRPFLTRRRGGSWSRNLLSEDVAASATIAVAAAAHSGEVLVAVYDAATCELYELG